MKTLKLVLITAVLALGITSMPAKSATKPSKVINLPLEQAVKDPGLLKAMYAQLTMEFIKVEKQGVYTALVRHNKRTYRIYAPHREWVLFFQIKPATLVNKTINHQ
jgi:hypothetical protein